MEIPIPALRKRGSRSFFCRKLTAGSADSATSAPRRKGENKGKKKRIASHTVKKARIMEENFRGVERKGQSLLLLRKMGLHF
jgi:hypothetical protein